MRKILKPRRGQSSGVPLYRGKGNVIRWLYRERVRGRGAQRSIEVTGNGKKGRQDNGSRDGERAGGQEGERIRDRVISRKRDTERGVRGVSDERERERWGLTEMKGKGTERSGRVRVALNAIN
jgi:hypothetical protein